MEHFYHIFVNEIPHYLDLVDQNSLSLVDKQLYHHLGPVVPRLYQLDQKKQMLEELVIITDHIQELLELVPDRTNEHICHFYRYDGPSTNELVNKHKQRGLLVEYKSKRAGSIFEFGQPSHQHLWSVISYLISISSFTCSRD